MREQTGSFRHGIGLILFVFSLQLSAGENHIGGFGTASLSCFSNEQADYVLNDQPEGAGRTRDCDAGLDSLLGVQLDLGLQENLDFGLQLIADRNEDRSYTPDVTVAQLRWYPSDATTLRLGRMPTPSFLHSEDRQVRYAQPWVRPPLEVYGLIPLFSNDGVELLYRSRLGDWNAEWQGGLTRIEFESPKSNADSTYPVESRQATLNVSLQHAGTLIKLGYSYGKVTLKQPDLITLVDALRSMDEAGSPGASELADDLAIEDSPWHLLALGMRYEKNSWLFMGEAAYRTIEGFFRDQYGTYLTLGRWMGPWMPYVTLAKRWTDGPDRDSRADALGIGGTIEELLASTRFDTTSVALGLSRHMGEHLVLKLQSEWIKPDDNSWGLYTNHAYGYGDADYLNPSSEWLHTVSLDFVF